MAATGNIIVIKRKSGHAGHHGGAWKVAYADFVTAMMALFIVLWLMNTSKPIQDAISGYFKDPSGNGKLTGSNQTGPKQTLTANKENMAKLKQELEKAMEQVANFDKLKNHIEMTLTPEGLRIELMESQKDTFFESGSPDPNGSGRELLMTIAEELGKLPNKLSIEGHTDSQPYSRTRELHQLGAFLRSCQCQPPPDAAAWLARRSGGAGARLCRPAAANCERPQRPVEPENLGDRAVSGQEVGARNNGPGYRPAGSCSGREGREFQGAGRKRNLEPIDGRLQQKRYSLKADLYRARLQPCRSQANDNGFKARVTTRPRAGRWSTTHEDRTP